MKDVEFGKLVGVDSRQLVFEATHHSVPLLVAQPYNSSLWNELRAHSADDASRAYVSLFADEQRRIAQLKEPMLPHVYGSCFDDLQHTRVVREYVEFWPALCADAALDLDQRLQIAANALELVRWFDTFPLYADGTRRRVVATTLRATAIGVSAYYVPKLLSWDALGLEPYQGDSHGALLADEPCVTDHDCSHSILVERGYMRAFKDVVAKHEDFRCNINAQRCYGLDSSSNLMSVCRVLLEPLLGVGGHAVPITVDAKRAHLLSSIVAACQFDVRDDRPSIDELQTTLRGMISAAAMPPNIVPRNDDIVQFLNYNASHEQIANGDARAGLLARASKEGGAPPPPPLSGAEVLLRLHSVVHAPSTKAIASSAATALNVSRWWFDFVRSDRGGHESRTLLAPPVRIFGYVGDERWASSPVYERVDSRHLLTHGGSVYRVDGKLDCETWTRHQFPKQLCAKFADGFPSDWGSLLATEYERQFSNAKSSYFGRYAPKSAIDFRYKPAVLSAATDTNKVNKINVGGGGGFRDAIDDNERSGGEDRLQCTQGELGCSCLKGLCGRGLACIGDMCMLPPQQQNDAGGGGGGHSQELSAEQLFSLRVLAQSAPCSSSTLSTTCMAQRLHWRDPTTSEAKPRLLAPCQWVALPSPGRCVYATVVRFVDASGSVVDAMTTPSTAELVGEVLPPKLPPHVVPLVGSVAAQSAAAAQPRCVETRNVAQDVPVHDVAGADLVELRVALRLQRAAVELAVGVAEEAYGMQLSKYAAVARVRRDGAVEAARGAGQSPRADAHVALRADVYYAIEFILDLRSRNATISIVDANHNGGLPLAVARDVAFLGDARALRHVGVIEMSGTGGAVVCVYEPHALHRGQLQKKPSPSLQFGGGGDAAGGGGGATQSNMVVPASRTRCCGNACTCCIFEHVKWDVLAYFAERFGLRTGECSMHDEVRHTFCRSTHGFSCAQQYREQCLFPCKSEQPQG
jgi:hypothetical protein